MIVLEAKLKGTQAQYTALDSALRTGLFVRNSCLRYWIDGHAKHRNDLNKYCKVLADNPDFPWVKNLNSMARQAMAERTWAAIARFFDNCKKKMPGKKGFPRFKRLQTRASVEYKTSGWKLSDCRRYITLTDGFEAGTFFMWGTRDLHFYQLKQIKRVRVVRRADGYYAQFCVDVERNIKREPTGKTLGLDVGLKHFYTDNEGNKVENPRFLRKSERRLKRQQRRLSRKQKGSKNRVKQRNRLGLAHLKIQRQRNDWACKLAQCVVKSVDLVAFEDLQVRNMVKNHKLAKSITDASWSMFRRWLEYFGAIYGVVTVAVPPQYTSQKCSSCGAIVKKTLSQRTHECLCGASLCRDENAAKNILESGLRNVGHMLTSVLNKDARTVEVGEDASPTTSSNSESNSELPSASVQKTPVDTTTSTTAMATMQ
ncbi:MAG: RNA-guided endonuclease InsQ/TnpB family protein [Xenococcaceae cyanobacterium]